MKGYEFYYVGQVADNRPCGFGYTYLVLPEHNENLSEDDLQSDSER